MVGGKRRSTSTSWYCTSETAETSALIRCTRATWDGSGEVTALSNASIQKCGGLDKALLAAAHDAS